MKKLTILAAVCLLFFTGCSQKKNRNTSISRAKLEEYETYYNAVLENPVFSGSSDNYSISFEMNPIPDRSYRYYVILDQARTAMYDVVMVAVENDIPYDSAKKMMPSSGIFDDSVTLIPGQVNKSEGFAKGIVLSGETKDKSINLKILVEWSNRDHTKKNREFLSFHLTPDKAEYQK